MFRLRQNQSISITRGDTGVINLSLKLNDADYVLGEGDTCLFTVKKSVNDKDALISKLLVDGRFTIEPRDTSGLSYGVYKYDIQVTTSDGIVSTVVTPKDFVVEPEVTW